MVLSGLEIFGKPIHVIWSQLLHFLTSGMLITLFTFLSAPLLGCLLHLKIVLLDGILNGIILTD